MKTRFIIVPIIIGNGAKAWKLQKKVLWGCRTIAVKMDIEELVGIINHLSTKIEHE